MVRESITETAARFSSWNRPQKTSTPLTGVTQHRAGNNIPCSCSHALIPVNLAFTVSPLKPNAAAPVCRMAPEIQSRKAPPKKASLARLQATLRMENLSATILLAAADKLLFYECQWAFCTRQASDLPGGAFTSSCTTTRRCRPWIYSSGAFLSLSVLLHLTVWGIASSH